MFRPFLLGAALLPVWVAVSQVVPEVKMLVPGFTVQELPVKLSNQNNLRFAPDGSLTTLGYDGRVWRLRDTDGDGLEDRAEPFWDRDTLTVPLGMCWSTDGLYVSSSGKVSLLRDSDGDGQADAEEIISRDWPAKDTASGNVDATAVTLDAAGNVYFGLLVQDYANAYRLRKRKDLKPAKIEWLKQRGRWHEPAGPGAADDEFSLYDLHSRRGTIQKFDPRTKTLETLATGIRVPVALAFNRVGDLFNTDQEGETWMPNGNPLDELNHIIPGRNYGFPPRHDRWLPDLVSEPPVVGFGPQHQSVCGLVFNEPRSKSEAGSRKLEVPLAAFPAQGLFGPQWWEGDAFVAGESRGKIWRVRLVKTPHGYVGKSYTIARLSMLTLDLAISPKGDLYVCCHSGPPDWGTGPQGEGKIFKISYTDPEAPQPVAVWPASPTEVRVAFDRPLDPGVTNLFKSAEHRSAGSSTNLPSDARRSEATIEFGEYVTAGDRFETLKPPYAVVEQQSATPRGKLNVRGVRLDEDGHGLVLTTDPHPLAVNYALTLPGVSGTNASLELDYDFTAGNTAALTKGGNWSREAWLAPVAWAPRALASAGTDSRPSPKPQGDWETGRDLFANRLQCAKCHRIHGEGGTAGPDLANVIHRDVTSLLRDIRDPGATLHPEYVTYQAELKNGESLVGFLRPAPQPEQVAVADVDGKETVVARADVANLHPTGQSLMPTGLLDSLNETQVRDLLTYLLWEPPVRSRADVAALVKVRAGFAPEAGSARVLTNAATLKIVLVAGKKDHGPGQHDYPRWQEKWLRLLARAATNAVVEKAWDWPTREQLATANVLVFYYWNHDWNDARYAQLDAFQQRGGGVVILHSACIADRDAEKLAERIGLSAQPDKVGYRHMPFDLRFVARDHPLTRGLPEWLHFLDEPYWPLIGDPARVKVLATADVDGAARPLVWTFEKGRGRVFGSILGHYFWTLDDPLYRLLVLRAIAWAGGADLERLTDAALLEAAVK